MPSPVPFSGPVRTARSVGFAVLLALSLLATERSRALELPGVFSDHMVLQRGMPLPVWGKAKPGSRVTVQLGAEKQDTQAAENGSWMLTLSPREASHSPIVLEVTDGTTNLRIEDVLVGEVWLCSGQSNMEWRVEGSLDGDLESLAGKNPNIRLLNIEKATATAYQFTNPARWQVADSSQILKFSAVGWTFGSYLQRALGVPVGLIHASWGGTPVISWTRPEVFPKHPVFIQNQEDWGTRMKTFPEDLAKWEKEIAAYREKKGLAPDAPLPGQKYPDAPKKPAHDPGSSKRPGVLAMGMLAPIAPYALRGAIWYQGESDANSNAGTYDERLALMVNDWRTWWNLPQMAFGVVQLAGYMPPKSEPSDDPWPNLRESQRQFVLNDPNAGLVVAIDAGEANDIHPRDKLVIGRRLARWALADVYKSKEVPLRGGPEPESWEFGGEVRVRFARAGQGLASLDRDSLGGFTLAGKDGIFHPAEARIVEKDTVVIRSEAVPTPVMLRYGWQNNPVDANLVNKERLPAAPFELSAHTPR